MRVDTTSGAIARRLLCGTVTASLSIAILLAVDTAARAQFDVETKLTASDGASFDRFGTSVGISGSTAIIGASAASEAKPGWAYLFDVTTGKELFKLTASDAATGDDFGKSVDISGNTAIIGARYNDVSGSAYLFDVTTGEQIRKLTSDAVGHFGDSVAIDGNTAIVGAEFDRRVAHKGGTAYLFDVTTGKQLFKLIASDDQEGDLFGSSVDISGSTAIVGAFSNDDAGFYSGSAYLFDVTTGEQLFKLTASDAQTGARFGVSVAIRGNMAVVGAQTSYFPGIGPDAGTAYLFDVTTGKELFKLTASDAVAHAFFGSSVAISDNTVIVGARHDDDKGVHSGSAYLFDATTGNELLKLTASDGAELARFGGSVDIIGNTAIVGARGVKNDGIISGSAYLFTSSSPLSDLTNNGFVDFDDLSVLLSNWDQDVGTALGNLVSQDDTPVNFDDLAVLLSDWTGPDPAGSPEAALGAASVPEPSSLVLALLATLGLSFYRRRRRRAG